MHLNPAKERLRLQRSNYFLGLDSDGIMPVKVGILKLVYYILVQSLYTLLYPIAQMLMFHGI
jgi:hypothetical protein